MMPVSVRNGWLEQLLEYLDERSDVIGDTADTMRANDFMRWHDALEQGLSALKMREAVVAERFKI